jgi:hypothetical protein
VSAATGDDPFVVGPVGEPASPERAVGNAVPVIVALVAWVLVSLIELVDVPNVSVGVLVVPVVEAAVWAAAVTVTVYVVWWVRRGGVVLGVLAALIGGAAFAYLTNWSVLEPRRYYEFHRWGFGQVAELVDEGELGALGDEYYGQRLPRYLADLSTNGRAATVARQDGKPVVFLAQFIGIPDDAVGYVYFDGEPDTDLLIDLFGYPFYLADGEPLGDGWWYVPDASLRWLDAG